MVFKTLSASALHRIPQLESAPACVHFDDVFGTEPDTAAGTTSIGSTPANPLTGSLFFLDYSDDPQPAPKYDYDETGVVLRGTLKIQDEIGKETILGEGDTFFVSRGSTIVFSTPSHAVAFKAAGRWRMPSRL
ncbi:uncharacterized protein BDV14DRAFT_195329 [Aspergillus stella-maris]|uniref:uncharacterized protein n=1 Tax=Aspergillus stella-maris TaxID=1810926 RepID=UPI003CCDCDB6